MQDATSIRVVRSTRDAVRALAEADCVTLDEEIRRLARAERQRRLGRELAANELTAEDERWVRAGGRALRDDARG